MYAVYRMRHRSIVIIVFAAIVPINAFLNAIQYSFSDSTAHIFPVTSPDALSIYYVIMKHFIQIIFTLRCWFVFLGLVSFCSAAFVSDSMYPFQEQAIEREQTEIRAESASENQPDGFVNNYCFNRLRSFMSGCCLRNDLRFVLYSLESAQTYQDFTVKNMPVRSRYAHITLRI